MSISTDIKCDGCGAKESLFSDSGEPPKIPDNWDRWERHVEGTVPVSLDICPSCAREIDLILKTTLVHIGHFKQSGSGKTFTELGRMRKADVERWHSVYALRVADGRFIGEDS